MQQVLQQFGNVEPFLQENVDLSAATRTKVLEILHDPMQLLLLKVELAAIVDMGCILCGLLTLWKEMDFL